MTTSRTADRARLRVTHAYTLVDPRTGELWKFDLDGAEYAVLFTDSGVLLEFTAYMGLVKVLRPQPVTAIDTWCAKAVASGAAGVVLDPRTTGGDEWEYGLVERVERSGDGRITTWQRPTEQAG